MSVPIYNRPSFFSSSSTLRVIFLLVSSLPFCLT